MFDLTIRMIVPVLVVGMLFKSVSSTSFSQTQWVQNEFILGTCWDPPLDPQGKSLAKDSASFELVKNAYFNLLTGIQGDGRINHSFEGMHYALTVASRVGLKYLVSDNRIYEAYEKPFDLEVARTLVGQYRSLPPNLRAAMYGYMLCDEPHFDTTHVRNVADWKWFLEEADPTKLPYINLVASYAVDDNWGGFKKGNGDRIMQDEERREYEAYLDFYIDSLQPAVVSFDHYPFFKDGSVRRDYFYNLKIIRQKSGERPFWTYPMTVDHYDYVDPQREHLYFMYFSPIAYGAKGLIVFTYWPPPVKGYRASLFDQKGRMTEKYNIIKRLNSYVASVLGPVVMRSSHLGAYHASNYPNRQHEVDDVIYEDSEVIASIANSKLMVGVFRNDKKIYLLAVNKSLQTIENAEFTVRGTVSTVYFAPRVVGFDESTSTGYKAMSTAVNQARNVTTIRIPELVGGEGRLIRLERSNGK